MMHTYILLDSALAPDIWQYLAFEKIAFVPLYRHNSTKIKTVIPYLIQLDGLREKLMTNFLTQKDYHSGLIIQSQKDLLTQVETLRYFYHVINEKQEPLLYRFFDLREFPDFINRLSKSHLAFLFSDDTVFYYLDKDGEFYHRITIGNNQLMFNQINQGIIKENLYENTQKIHRTF